MAGTIDLRGGAGASSYAPFVDYDNIYVYDSCSYPSGNKNRAGSVVVGISGVSIPGSGMTAATVSSSGIVYVYNGTPRLTFYRNPGVGGRIYRSYDAGYWDGGMCGSYSWYTVPSKPASISPVRTGRNVTVTCGTSSDNGGYAITSYYVRYRKNGGAWSAEVAAVAGVVTFNNLDASATYEFAVSAYSAAGYSEERISSPVFIPAGGKRRDGAGVYNPTTIAKRKNNLGVWVDITIAKRKASGVWTELGS